MPCPLPTRGNHVFSKLLRDKDLKFPRMTKNDPPSRSEFLVEMFNRYSVNEQAIALNLLIVLVCMSVEKCHYDRCTFLQNKRSSH